MFSVMLHYQTKELMCQLAFTQVRLSFHQMGLAIIVVVDVQIKNPQQQQYGLSPEKVGRIFGPF